METHACCTEGCSNEGSLRCPTCKDMGISGQFFCSQSCFKGSWETHKLVHKAFKAEAAAAAAQHTAVTASVRLPKSFDGYIFSGKLRPGVVGPRAIVPKHILKPDYAETGVPTSEMRLKGSSTIPVLSDDDRIKMRRACRIAREVLDIAAAALRPGITGTELDAIVYSATIERGCYPSPLNYHGFPKSVCVSVNEVICHGIPDSRPVADGDIVNLDVTIYSPDGFHADLNETFAVGKVDSKGRTLIRCAYECLEAAIALCRPGAMYRDLGAVISKIAKEAGFSVVKSYCGHGIGRLFHCSPNVPHYAQNKAVGFMKPGHVFTIEPMINEGSSGDETWPDNWTAVTRDGLRSAQFEQTLLITEEGVEVLTARGEVVNKLAPWAVADFERPTVS